MTATEQGRRMDHFCGADRAQEPVAKEIGAAIERSTAFEQDPERHTCEES